MADYSAPLKDMQFVLHHQLNAPELWQQLGLVDVDADTANAVLEEAGRLVQEVIAPLNREADEAGCVFDNGRVRSPEGFISAYKLFCEGGWGALGGNPEFGGMGMPKSLVSAVEELVQGACMSFGLAPMLTSGACLALDAHASEALKNLYLEKMYTGQWAGAMDLTEPQAGTDLGLIKTKAEPRADGSYTISGSKIFITWGEHDMAENIVHLVLARLPDAPAGSRGISMFLVPKFIPGASGELGERNGVHCGSIEKKMGIKGSSTCVMNYDQAQAWLLGDANKGLQAMFTMMNYERLIVGIQGVGAAEASYQNAAEYARERLQGRSMDGHKYPEKPADPLLVHADVRRMLLTMRSLNEAGRAFYIYVAKWLDVAKFGRQDKALAENMVALLTPIAKAFLTDRAFDTAVLGQQILGGHGFIREWGQEQHVRDIRITQIYEGTNGVQAMDLIGRKTFACKGELLQLLIGEMEKTCELATAGEGAGMADALRNAMVLVDSATAQLVAAASEDKSVLGAAAVDYLDMLGYLCYGHMWLLAVNAAESIEDKAFAAQKRILAQFYFDRLLPQVKPLAARIASGAGGIMAMREDWF